MKKFGEYGINPEHPSLFYYDVAVCQYLLPKGVRIRKKKAKRRFHNKSARMKANTELRKEVYDLDLIK